MAYAGGVVSKAVISLVEADARGEYGTEVNHTELYDAPPPALRPRFVERRLVLRAFATLSEDVAKRTSVDEELVQVFFLLFLGLVCHLLLAITFDCEGVES